MITKYTLPLLISAFILTGCTTPPLSQAPPTSSPTALSTPAFVTISPTSSTAEDPSIAVKKDLVAKHGPTANNLKVIVSKIEGNYSSGSANEENGGGMWFAAKVEGVWKLVWDGNGIITCDDLTDYPDFPASFIPQCYDTKTDKLVKR